MKLSQLLEGLSLTGQYADTEISDIAYDSRKAGKNIIFTALVGANADGHAYVKNAYEAGSRVFLTEREVSLPADACVLRCDDTRAALAHISANFFSHPDREIAVVGVTGTKGKTTVTHMLHSVFDLCGIPSGVIGTVGAYWGGKSEETVNTTPESYEMYRLLRRMRTDGIRVVFAEVSSLGLKQHRVDGILFDTAVFTNFSPDHVGGIEHATLEEYAYWKTQLFYRCKRAVLNADDAFCDSLRDKLPCPCLTFSAEENRDFTAENIRFVRSGFLGMRFDLLYANKSTPVTVGMPGIFSVYNALAAAAVANLFGVPEKTLCEALLHARVRGRMESVPCRCRADVLIDYAHNGVSFRSVMETVREYEHGKLFVVFGCVGGRAQVRRREMAEIAAGLCDRVIVSTDDPQFEDPAEIAEEVAGYVRSAGGNCTVIVDRREAIRYALRTAEQGDIVLLLGKGHEEYMKICGEKIPFSEREIVTQWC